MRTVILFLLALGMVQASVQAQVPVITNQPASRAVWEGCNVTFAVGVSGAGPFTYQWQLNGTNLPSGIISTVAGSGYGAGTFGGGAYAGDGGPAANADFNSPCGVAVDASGNLFIGDDNNNRVREVNTSGIICTVAGGGTNSPGDGGPATNAAIQFPFGLVLDVSADLFITDYLRIREMKTNGIITTVAGNGYPTYSGDGGPATNASLWNPQGVALDALGNLFIADFSNERIRKVNANGIISTVAGNGRQGYSGDGSAATHASLSWPADVALDASGNLFIAEFDNACIRKVDTNGIISTVAGRGTNYPGDGGAATNVSLGGPIGVLVDASGNLFVAEKGRGRIRKVSTNGIITTVAGDGLNAYSGDGGPATNASLYYPFRVALDAAGNLFIADTYNQRIRKVTNTQGAALALNDVTATNAGNYQVMATGPSGSVTSSVATLTVATAPLIYQTVPHSDGSVTLYFVSQPSSTSVVLSTTNLSPPVLWQPLSTNVAGGDGDWQYTDTNAAGWQARFYRSATR